MTTEAPRMLGEILYHCSRCGLTLNHRITLMNGNQPARVLCLTCKSERTYRAQPTSVRKRVTTQPAGQTRKADPDSVYRAKLQDRSQTPVPYKSDATFLQDQHIYHPTFGHGIVTGFIHPNKVTVYFESGSKTLMGKKD